MKDKLCKAIKERIVISFDYEGHNRTVEPFTLGIHKDTGNMDLSAFLIGGYSKSESKPYWRLYTVSDISNLVFKERKASSYRNGYNPNDKRMSRIICTV